MEETCTLGPFGEVESGESERGWEQARRAVSEPTEMVVGGLQAWSAGAML